MTTDAFVKLTATWLFCFGALQLSHLNILPVLTAFQQKASGSRAPAALDAWDNQCWKGLPHVPHPTTFSNSC